MKILKIKDSKGFFCLDNGKFVEIDKVDKNYLMQLLDIALSEDFEMDDYKNEENKIVHKAHEIIYRNLFDKFDELRKNKDEFKNQSKNLYKEALEKYKDKEKN